MAKHGLGRHAAAVINNPDILTLTCVAWICQATYKVSLQLTKISLVLLYMRIFGTVKWFRMLSLGLVVFLVMFSITGSTAGLLECTPVRSAWDFTIKNRTCVNTYALFLTNGVLNTATDVVVLIMPLPLIFQLKVSMGQKLALLPIFLLGIFCIIVSTLRMVVLVGGFSTDSTWDIETHLWSIVEMNVALICACLPAARLLLGRIFPKTFGNLSALNPRSHSGSNPTWESRTWGGSGWSRVDSSRTPDNSSTFQMTNANKGSESSSDNIEHIESQRVMGIQRTVTYKVEY
jgi:hypothetical protein